MPKARVTLPDDTPDSPQPENKISSHWQYLVFLALAAERGVHTYRNLSPETKAKITRKKA